MSQSNNHNEFSLFENGVQNLLVDVDAPPVTVLSKDNINIIAISEKQKISYADIINTIIDLGCSPQKYNYKSSANNKKSFWAKAKTYEILYKIFYGISSETLKEVWKEIKNSLDIDRFYLCVNENEEVVNDEENDLKILIKGICAFISSKKDVNFAIFLKDYMLKRLPKKKYKRSFKLLQKKRLKIQDNN